jgi:DNA-directed RNA polymerase subunit RPC12/RpoP
MPISVLCASCNAKLQAPESAAGRNVKCPKCGKAVLVPDGRAAAPAAKPSSCRTVKARAAGEKVADKPSAVQKAGLAPAAAGKAAADKPSAVQKAAPADKPKAAPPPVKAKPAPAKKPQAEPPEEAEAVDSSEADGSAWEESPLLQYDEWTFREQGWMRLAIKNRHFHICKSATKDIIGYADEKASGFVLALRGMSKIGKWLPTTVEIREEQEGPLLLAIRKINIPLLPWTDVEIYDGQKQKLGHFRTKIFSLLGGFWLYDAEGKEVAEVKAKLGMPPRYLFLSKDGRELGSVATEAMTKAAETKKMQVQVTLTTPPLRLKVAPEMAEQPRVKVLMLATALAFEFTGAGALLQ